LQFLVQERTDQTARCSQSPGDDEAASPTHYTPEPGTQHLLGRRGTTRVPRWVEELLPARRHARHLPRPRCLDPPPPEGAPTEALEERVDRVSGVSRSGTLRRKSRQGCSQHQELVEKLWPGDQRRPALELLRQPRPAEACHVTSTLRTAGCGPARPVVWE